MKRSEINKALKRMESVINDLKISLPPFCNFTPEEWQTKGHEYDEIRDNMLGWDITDYGLGDFEKTGFSLITLRNGNLKAKDKYPKPYAEKLLFIEEGQYSPNHFHWFKMEDIINKGGGNLLIRVYNSLPDEEIDKESDVTVHTDGRTYQVKAGTQIRLTPGESISIQPYMYHDFDYSGGKCNLVNSNFLDCSADYGAAIYGCFIIVVDCNFVNCSDMGEYGGVICVPSDDDFAFIEKEFNLGNCSFVNCSGGAISGANTVVDCSFVNCSANSGGVMSVIGSVVDCSFVNCSGGAISGANTVIDCSFVNCSGGALSDVGSVVDCSFVNCSGDAITNVGSADDCNFINCYGTAIYFYMWSSNSSVFGCSFVNCTGGAIGLSSSWRGFSVIIIGNCSFVNCSARDLRYSDGGAIWATLCSNSDVIISNCSFVNCAAGEGGALSFENNQDCNFTIHNCSFVNCSANIGGAIISWENRLVFLHVIGSSFVNCSGGAIRGADTVIDCSFVNCSANYGGAIAGVGSVVDCSFVNCSAYGRGGAIAGVGSVVDCIFVNCSAVSEYSEGGAIFNRADEGSVFSYVVGCSFVNCSAVYGGAILMDSGMSHCSINVSDCSFVNCHATCIAGAIGSDYANIDSCDFVNCSAYSGAAIFIIRDYLSCINSNFMNNSGSRGNAIMWFGLNGNNPWIDQIYGNSLFEKDSNFGNLTIKNSYFAEDYPLYGPFISINNNILEFNVKDDIWSYIVELEGNVTLKIGDKIFEESLTSGTAYFDLNGFSPNIYDIGLIYSGDDEHSGVEIRTPIVLKEQGILIRANDVTKYYKGPERFVVTVTDYAGNPIADANIIININGVDYDRKTGATGQTSVALGIPSGNYTATVTYGDIKTESNIVIKSTVSGDNITKIFRNATQYYAKFLDTNGNILKNTPVIFNINGVFYTRTTNENGVAKMNINLNPGEYIITATNPNSGEMYSNVVTVLPNIAENHDMTKYYRNASQYVVRLLDDEGNPVGAGVDVTFNINGVFYVRTTNATGHAKLNINLGPGTYIITAMYKDMMAANTITVLPVLEAKDLNMKYKDGSKFEAKLLDGQGKPYAGQNITFNVNGVFYERTTDVNGIARLNINLMAGEYIITSSYSGSNIANKITISS